MLIEFTVGNFRSFKDPVTFSMVAAGLTARDKSLDENNVFDLDAKLHLLKSAAIYGANASGKSNLTHAVKFMRQFVLNSSKDTQASESIPIEPFRLSTDTATKPSHFEMVFALEGRRYRYGFELTSECVVAEWLYHVPTVREAKLFERRDGRPYDLSPTFKEGKDLWAKTRDNALFLSVVAQFNGPIARSLLDWFGNLGVISGLDDDVLFLRTLEMLKDIPSRDAIVQFVKSLDLGVDDIETRKTPWRPQLPKDVPDEFKALFTEIEKLGDVTIAEHIDVMTAHRSYDAKGKQAAVVFLDINRNESHGTRKLFALAGPLLHALRMGKLLFIDELDARLHPLLTQAIIALFNSNTTNPKNAQLVFVTHDTNLLSKELFRRDQIWFAEKDRFGATHLYSLAEYNVRNDASFENNYIRGKYGAVPFLGDLTRLMEPVNE
jgi:hypothetical protein